MSRSRKTITVLVLLLCIAPLSGCGSIKDRAESVLEQAGQELQPAMDQAAQTITDALDELREGEYQGGPFENDLESARAYLLDQLHEKYGIEFAVVGNERLKNYGPFSGASYSCEAAPIDHPERLTKAIVSQTVYQDVQDNYAIYYFKEEAEKPAYDLCASKSYVLDQRISLEAPGTAKRWTGEEGLETYLSESGAYVRILLRFEDGLEVRAYAEQLLDFLNSVQKLNCNILLQAKANKTYIFHEEIHLLDGFDPSAYSLEQLEEEIEEDFSMGSPVP